MLTRSFFILALSHFLIPLSLAQTGDLDVEGARQRYESQKRISDQKQAEHARQVEMQRSLEQSLQRAQNDLNQAKNQLAGAESNLSRIDAELRSNDRDQSQLEYDISRLESQKADLVRQLPQLQRQVDSLQYRVRDAELRLQQIDQELARLRVDPEGNAAQIAQLESQRGFAQSDLQREQADLYAAQSRLQDASRRVDALDEAIRRGRREFADLRLRASELERARQVTLNDIQFYRSEVSRNENQVREVSFSLQRQREVTEQARLDYQRELERTRQAETYYQQVQRNYQREVDRIYAVADQAASAQAQKEAEERASVDGANAGVREGSVAGGRDGGRDGRLDSDVSGYRSGRENPVADAFALGVEEGKRAAQNKAREESLPRGYNDALTKALERSPTSEVDVDLREDAWPAAQPSGSEWKAERRVVGQVAAPAYSFPQNPGQDLPAAPVAQVQVPSADGRYQQIPCSGLARPEFGAMCENRYRSTFTNAFQSQYRQSFQREFAPRWKQAYEPRYREARGVVYQDAFAAARMRGSKEQGILDGFAQNIAQAQVEAFAEGERLLARTVEQSYFLVVKEIVLSERVGDGIYSPGETLDIDVVVDNLGAMASVDKDLRVVVESQTGVQNLRFESRELPSVAGFSRVRWMGTTSLQAKSLYADDPFRLTGRIEKRSGSQWQALASFDLGGKVGYPLQLVDLKLAAVPALNALTDAQLVFKNQTREVMEARTIEFKGAGIELAPNQDLQLGEMEPGATLELPLKVKFNAKIGENLLSFFDVKSIGEETLVQPFKKLVRVQRTASALVYNDRMQEIPEGRIAVSVGQTVKVPAIMKYHATTQRPGPFVLRATTRSHPDLRHANNSTISVNYGSWGPGRTTSPTSFQYVIPPSLRGKSASVVIQLEEGRSVLHEATIHFDVRP